MEDRIEIKTYEEFVNYLSISKKDQIISRFIKEDGLTDDDRGFLLIDLIMDGVHVKFIINEELNRKFYLKVREDSKEFYDKVCKVLNK